MGLRVATFDGGNLRNAIPREAWATVALPADQYDSFTTLFNKFSADVRAE